MAPSRALNILVRRHRRHTRKNQLPRSTRIGNAKHRADVERVFDTLQQKGQLRLGRIALRRVRKEPLYFHFAQGAHWAA